MGGKDVLLIATRLRLLAVDVTKLKILHYSSYNEFTAPTLPVVQVFDFVDGGYSFGARFFMWGSKLYMAGGERTRWDASQEELSRPLGAGFPLESRASKRSPLILVSDFTTPDSISKVSRANFRMITEKPSPIIVEFGGKLYVLSGPSWHYNHPLESPTFEVYDPSLDEFEPLPDPPFYIDNNFNSYDCAVAGYCLVQSSIYMLVGNRCYCYRIQDNQWDADGTSMDEIGVHRYALPCFSGQFVPGYNDIFICFRFHSLIAIMLRDDGAHSFQYIDDEVFYPNYHPDSFSYKGLVVAMDGHGMCILKPVMAKVGNTNRCVLYVATFHVKKLDSSVDDAKRALTSAESSIAPTSKIAKMVTDSDIGNSHHHRDVRESDDSASLQESDPPPPPQESDPSPPPQESDPPPPSTPRPFVSITCLSKGFYDLETWGPEIPYITSAFFHRWE